MRTFIAVIFITTFLVMIVLSASAAIDPNMILWFSFDEQIDGRQVEDLTGGGNNGKLKLGAKLTDVPEEIYKGAGAVKFTNISAQVRVEPFKRMNEYNEHTYAFWIYIFSNTAKPWNWEHCGAVPCGEGRASIMEKGNILEGAVKGWAPGILIQEEPLALIYQFQDKGGGGLQGALGAKGIVGPGGNGTEFEFKKWYHIAGVKQAAELIIYVDGKEQGRFPAPREFVQGEALLRLGGTRERSAHFAMDEFSLYDRALTDKEVELDARGVLLWVEPEGKLTTTWGDIKVNR
ncbi:hypothetical protein GBAR_LOCUS15653 [Geodia barretti]|uniref:LamG-like jellyroll fold domain-containing protein n=1 Tax=Geodia barretti TaxID=519541 RepID=A0AA35SCA9_GEOBA|nr:hypothetical protein GBAR_LOCUS15653 [Geodia barretti]